MPIKNTGRNPDEPSCAASSYAMDPVFFATGRPVVCSEIVQNLEQTVAVEPDCGI